MDKQAIRARIDLIAYERGLPASEVAKAKTLHTLKLVAFAREYRLSLDWLIAGDLRSAPGDTDADCAAGNRRRPFN